MSYDSSRELNYLTNILQKYDKIKTLFNKSLNLTNDISNNLDILKAYFNTISEVFNEIDYMINLSEYQRFINSYRYNWHLSNTEFIYDTIKLLDNNPLESFNNSIISGLYLLNSNNINTIINIGDFDKENNRYNTNIPIDYDKKYIENDIKNINSIFNINNEIIFYILVRFKSFIVFLESPDSMIKDKQNKFIDILNKYNYSFNRWLDKLKMYYDLEIIKNN